MILADDDRAILDLERLWWRYAGAKAAAIHERFGCTEAAYYARLNALLDDPATHAHDPQLLTRPRRLPDQRRAARQAS